LHFISITNNEGDASGQEVLVSISEIVTVEDEGPTVITLRNGRILVTSEAYDDIKERLSHLAA